ncbi:MAG TPA: MauE/DoxX family redox-associated membrane protein, partial [Thermomicrobiales bacterium]|nr:MauE/DoxX family redox-associated membrane protein [Thermomicrobiales bacterium]
MLDVQTLGSEPHLVLFARVVVGLVLLIAGAIKLGGRRHFAEIVRGYRLLPGNSATAVGSLLPLVELVVGISLLGGLLMPWTALAAIGLFLLFGVAIGVNLCRGRRDL